MLVDKSIQLILFEQIKSALQPLITSGDIKEIQVYNNQMDSEGASKERMHKYPLVTVEMVTEWMANEVGSGEFILQQPQKGRCNLIIHVICEYLDYETETFTYVENIRHNVFRALNLLDYTYTESGQNYCSFSALIRLRSNVDHDHDGMIDFTTEFYTLLTESGLKQTTQTAAYTDIELTKNIDIDEPIIRTGDGTF